MILIFKIDFIGGYQILNKMFNFFNKSPEQGGLVEDCKHEIIEQLFVNQKKDKIDKKYEFPASFKKAKLHQKAVKFGYNAPRIKRNKGKEGDENYGADVSTSQYQAPKLCACCNQPVNTRSIGLFYHTTNPQAEEKPYLLNSSAAMFYSFIKMAILYLLLVFFICGAFNLFTSIDGSYCLRHTKLCQKSFFQMISTYNKYKDIPKQSLFQIQNILCLVVVVLSIVYFIIYRKIQYNIYEAIDAQHQTQDDYTLFVENIPVLDFKNDMQNNEIEMMEFNYQSKLKNIFQTEINSWIRWMRDQQSLNGVLQNDFIQCLQGRRKTFWDTDNQNKITTISLCFDLGELQKINIERQALMDEQIQLHNLQRNIEQVKAVEIQNQVQALNKIELNLCERFAVDNSPTFNITHFVGKAFISFQYQHYREYIMQKYEDGSRQFKYGNKTLTLSRASHPTDIYWTNMKISDSMRTRKVIISYFIIGMILFFSAAALIGIDFIKLMGLQSGTQLQPQIVVLNYCLSIIASFVATGINYGISYIVKNLTEYEKHQTMTNKLTSMIIKIVISQFINTAFIFYLIQVYNNRPYLSSAGLVVQVSTLLIVSGCVSIFTSAVNVPYLIRKGKLWYKYGYSRYTRSQSQRELPTYQIRLNKDYEYPVFDIAGKYSYYLVHVYTCMFYSYLVPVGVLAVAVLFGIQFWIDKIQMFKLSSQYNQIGYFLSRMILKMFQGSLLVFTLGNLIFSTVIERSYHPNILNIISLGIAVIYVCFISFAPTALERKMFANYEVFQKEPYSESVAKHKFRQFYWTSNPATVFAREVDVNDKDNFVQQKSIPRYANMNDQDQIQSTGDDGIQEQFEIEQNQQLNNELN